MSAVVDRRFGGPPPAVIPTASAETDALLAFGAEHGSKPIAWRLSRRLSVRTWLIVFALASAIPIAALVYVPAWIRGVSAPATIGPGTATINSRPEGAQVTIDGVARGVTPLKLSLPAGQHSLLLTNGRDVRTLPLAIETGTLVSQYIDLAPAAPAAPVERLDVTSDPPGAQVTVDGQARGATPLTIASVGSGRHEVMVSTGESRVRRVVDIAPGATASVFVSVAPKGASVGWISMKTPIELQIFDAGKLIGTTSADAVMLLAGRHDLELANPAFAFRKMMTVEVEPGKTATPALTLPNGSLSINAVPWAEVWLDGKPAGTTPLANLPVPIGNHEIIWRHPQLGERRQTIAVTTRTPARVGIEFSK